MNLYFQKAAKTKNEEGEEVEAEAAASVGNLPDILGDSKIWETAGVGLGEYEVLLIAKSLKALAGTSGAS